MKQVLHHSIPVNVNKEDMSVAMTLVQPSGMREVQLEIPQVIGNIYIHTYFRV